MSMDAKRRLTIARIFALVAVIAISLFIYSIRDQAVQLAKYGYVGIFFIALLGSATILLPAPAVLLVSTMGAVFNPFWVGIFAGLGAAVGELSGYLIGFSGQAIVEKAELYEYILQWMNVHQLRANVALVILAIIPNPIFDIAGIAAGTLKIPVIRFLILVAIGNILKMWMFAYTGSTLINWFNNR